MNMCIALAWLSFVMGATLHTDGATGPTGDDYALRAVPKSSIALSGGFWKDRVDTNHLVTLPHSFEQCEQTGRLKNFKKAAGELDGEHEGYFFNDSDVYKIIEGAAYAMMLRPDPETRAYVDRLIDDIAAAQEDDGYLNTYYTLAEPDAKWSNVRVRHELYCAGHLFDAAVAYYEATGNRKLLEVAIKFADLIDAEFGPDARREPPGHQQIEMGLVRLFRATGEPRYLELAEFFLAARGDAEGHDLFGPYAQDHLPVEDQREAVGHAVRAAYMYAGMADVGVLTGNDAYLAALDDLWQSSTGRKMYLTGAIGASRAGEAYGVDYELPNESAYAETCGAIANALWNDRMLRLHRHAKYADIVERAIYNGFLVGVSLEGDRFFYPNPLATNGVTPFNHGSNERSAWFACACCPSNDVRFIPTILEYLYATDSAGNVFVNQFAAGAAEIDAAGRTVRIVQDTEYPWDGRITLRIEPDSPGEFAVNIRVPGWARGEPVPTDLYRYLDEAHETPTLSVNGTTTPIAIERGYAKVEREWQSGDTITLALPMPVRRVIAHEKVEANNGRVALERGPIVYCLEAVDSESGRALNIALPDDAELSIERRPEMLGGIVTIHGVGVERFRSEGASEIVVDQPVGITAIPYYAWNHRGPGEMTVWLPREPALIKAPPKPTLASRSRASASHTWSSDVAAAVNDLAEPETSSDQTIPRHTFWDHRGTTEWLQLDLPEKTEVSGVELYWFDDTGVGQCRVPRAWRLLYRDAQGRWIGVETDDDFGCVADQYNSVEFDPIETDGLRVVVDLQPDYSGGVLEWKVN
ncbi:MAG: beta-L-arabinofuranosidase domain-containing protein [Phycisphaerales bacterium]